MENKKICFTKIGTVKCDKFEMTFDDFIKKFSYLIVDNCNENNVHYDSDDNLYVITCQGNKYQVKYGNEYLSKNDNNITEYLNQLITLSKIQEKLHNEVVAKKEEINKIKAKAMENAKNGILNTIKENEAKIELILDEDKKSQTRVFDNTIETLLGLCVGEIGSGLFFFRLFFSGCGLLFSLGLAIGAIINVPLYVIIIAGFASLDALALLVSIGRNEPDDDVFKGLYVLLFALLISPFVLGYNIIKRINEKGQVNKKIKILKEKINNLKRGEAINTKAKLNVTKEVSPNKNNLAELVKEFDELKDSIMSINNENRRNQYSVDLYHILEKCSKNSNNRDLVGQLETLKKKVENEIQKQDFNNSYYKLMNEIKEKKDEPIEEESFQKTIGARKY